MKLRNKKTGEIGRLIAHDWLESKLIIADDDGVQLNKYDSLAELNEKWEDAPEEPKEWWYIDIHGPHEVTNNDEYYQQVKIASKEIGNYFETKEEAEKAVEKLKAWKRLKDKGFRFDNFVRDAIYYEISDEEIEKDVVREDLTLLFGGEE